MHNHKVPWLSTLRTKGIDRRKNHSVLAYLPSPPLEIHLRDCMMIGMFKIVCLFALFYLVHGSSHYLESMNFHDVATFVQSSQYQSGDEIVLRVGEWSNCSTPLLLADKYISLSAEHVTLDCNFQESNSVIISTDTCTGASITGLTISHTATSPMISHSYPCVMELHHATLASGMSGIHLNGGKISISNSSIGGNIQGGIIATDNGMPVDVYLFIIS